MSEYSRRAVLGATAAIGSSLAGCTGMRSSTPPESSATSSSSKSPSATTSPPPSSPVPETPQPGQCEPTHPPAPDTAPERPDPKPYPDRPERLTIQTVTTFLAAYEEAYQFNTEVVWLQENDACVADIGADVGKGQTDVWAARNGYQARVRWASWIHGGPCPTTRTKTVSPAPRSYRTGETAYYITDKYLIRNGTVTECWTDK